MIITSIRDLVRAERASENRAAMETGVGGFWDEWNAGMDALNREFDRVFVARRWVWSSMSDNPKVFVGMNP